MYGLYETVCLGRRLTLLTHGAVRIQCEFACDGAALTYPYLQPQPSLSASSSCGLSWELLGMRMGIWALYDCALTGGSHRGHVAHCMNSNSNSTSNSNSSAGTVIIGKAADLTMKHRISLWSSFHIGRVSLRDCPNLLFRPLLKVPRTNQAHPT